VIKAIIFDCFGVLTTDTWRAFVDGLPPEADAERARSLNKQYDAGLLNKQDFLQQVFEITGQKPKYVDDMLDSETIKNEKLLEYIKDLKATYKIGLLSNVATNWIVDYFLTDQERALFDDMVFSFIEGVTKPDERIFKLACERLSVDPTEAVMVDDIERYCQAAQSTGMKAVCYTDFSQFKADLQQILSQS
jgi:epoxide hydrolase-like predicted phosphatase